MTNVNNEFAAQQNTTTGARALAGTAQLTSLSESISTDIMRTIDADMETYRELLNKSKASHDAMDQLIEAVAKISEMSPDANDLAFLKNIDDATLEGMLKSQQSKRSRAKGKVMTLDNYMSMMTGAVAELLIRLVTGKAKSQGARRTNVQFTAEDLERLAADQDALRKEIRNVQSKKSIMKSKADFSEESPEWLELLEAEQALKDIRVGGTPASDPIRTDLKELLGEANFDQLKGADAKELLKAINAKLNS